MNEEREKIALFQEGFKHYKSSNYFDAHEAWEELWSDYYLVDKKFIQGLIQLSVSFVHLDNGNLNGAKSLLKKSREKFVLFPGTHRGINLEILIHQIDQVDEFYAKIKKADEFDWELVPHLN